MEKTAITKVTLDEARELYNSHNKTLKELALKCFPENELSENITNMKIETLPISVRQARAWYNTGIEDFEKLALKFFDKENKSIAPIYSIVDDEKLDYICIETSLNDELFTRNK